MEKVKLYLLSMLVIVSITSLVLFLNSEDELTGYQTASQEQTFTASIGGVGVTEIDFKEPRELVKLEGTSCFDHTGKRRSWYDRHRTGHYYRFEFSQVPVSGKAEIISRGKTTPVQIEVDPIFYPAPPNWFGGKGRGCNPISATFKPNAVAKKLVIKGHLVGGRPRFNANFKLTTKPAKKTEQPAPQPTKPPTVQPPAQPPKYEPGICTSGGVYGVQLEPKGQCLTVDTCTKVSDGILVDLKRGFPTDKNIKIKTPSTCESYRFPVKQQIQTTQMSCCLNGETGGVLSKLVSTTQECINYMGTNKVCIEKTSDIKNCHAGMGQDCKKKFPQPQQPLAPEVFDFEIKDLNFYQQGVFLGDASISKNQLQPDVETTIKVLMKSQSVQSPVFPLHFYIDGKEVYKKTHKLYFLKGYPPGNPYSKDVEEVTLTFTPKLTEGQHFLKVAIDPEKLIQEEVNKNNNVYGKTLTVKSKTVVQQPTPSQQSIPQTPPTTQPSKPLQNTCEDSDKTNNPVIAGYLKVSVQGKTIYEGDKIEGNNILETLCVSSNPLNPPYSKLYKVFCPSGTKPEPVQLNVEGSNVLSAKCIQTQTQLQLSIKNLRITQKGVQVANNVEAGVPVSVEFFIQNDGIGEATPTYTLKFDNTEYPDKTVTLYSTNVRKGAQNVRKYIPADKITIGKHSINLKIDGTKIDQTFGITVVPQPSPAERTYQTVFPTYTCPTVAPMGAKCLAEGKQGICKDSKEPSGAQGKRCTFDANLDGCTNYGMPCKTSTAPNGYCAYLQQPRDLRLNCRPK